MILVFDTYYFENKAKTVCLEFNQWTDEQESNIYEETLEDINEYVSGEFYKRELPCILSLLKKISLENCEAIIIDGFVVLNDEDKNGLGGFLYQELNKCIPIIGVAKNNFNQITLNKRAVYRGNSKKPLYITAKGINLDEASQKIMQMNGDYRIPYLLKRVDSIGRENNN